MDGSAYAGIGAAAANMGHGRIYVLVGRLGFFLEQGHSSEHLSPLAIAALRHLMVNPGLLHRMQFSLVCQSFDADHFLTIRR